VGRRVGRDERDAVCTGREPFGRRRFANLRSNWTRAQGGEEEEHRRASELAISTFYPSPLPPSSTPLHPFCLCVTSPGPALLALQRRYTHTHTLTHTPTSAMLPLTVKGTQGGGASEVKWKGECELLPCWDCVITHTLTHSLDTNTRWPMCLRERFSSFPLNLELSWDFFCGQCTFFNFLFLQSAHMLNAPGRRRPPERTLVYLATVQRSECKKRVFTTHPTGCSVLCDTHTHTHTHRKMSVSVEAACPEKENLNRPDLANWSRGLWELSHPLLHSGKAPPQSPVWFLSLSLARFELQPRAPYFVNT